jgi:hypothetical protein
MTARRLVGMTAVLVLVLAFAIPAGAAPSVAITEVVRNGALATVTGTAAFTPSADAVDVGGTNTNLGPAQAAEARGAAGLDLTKGLIQPLADGSGLRFIWQVTNLPDQVPPEGVRYTWALAIGGRQFQLQAKRTNMTSVTTAEDPVNHVQALAANSGFFQLRGACVASYEGAPINGCYHLAFLRGGFDTAKDQVYIDWPYETRDEIGRLVAPEFKPGVTLDEAQSAGMSIAAGLQAVASTAQVSDFINGWTPYFVGKVVQVGVGAANANPTSVAYTTSATLSGDTFTATVGGLSAAKNAVFVRACSTLECSYATVTPS